MKLNWLSFAVPLFLCLILIEFYIARRKQKKYFRLHSSIANLSIGIAERLSDVFTISTFFFVYDLLQKKYGIFHIQSNVLAWMLLLITTDLVWYWYHRLAHEINIFWAIHVVHHQSEDFNYTASARITMLQAMLRTGFWSILPVIGFPAEMITSILLIHGLYPFFIHTRTIGKLGVLEYILVTPSHHRVHHACNEKYLDRNYGDVFIIWDKLFGTFQKEEDNEEIVYGLTKQLKCYSFLWQHFHFAAEIFYTARGKKGWNNKWKVLFARPKTIDSGARAKAERKFNIYKKDIPVERPLNKYVIWQISITLAALFSFILFEKEIPSMQQLYITCFIILTLVNCGAIMEQKIWITYLEFSRLVLVGISLVTLSPTLWLACILILAIALIYYYGGYLRKEYLKMVYRSQLASI